MTDVRQGGPVGEPDLAQMNGHVHTDQILSVIVQPKRGKAIFQFWFSFIFVVSILLVVVSIAARDIPISIGQGIVFLGILSVEVRYGIIKNLLLE